MKYRVRTNGRECIIEVSFEGTNWYRYRGEQETPLVFDNIDDAIEWVTNKVESETWETVYEV